MLPSRLLLHCARAALCCHFLQRIIGMVVPDVDALATDDGDIAQQLALLPSVLGHTCCGISRHDKLIALSEDQVTAIRTEKGLGLASFAGEGDEVVAAADERLSFEKFRWFSLLSLMTTDCYDAVLDAIRIATPSFVLTLVAKNDQRLAPQLALLVTPTAEEAFGALRKLVGVSQALTLVSCLSTTSSRNADLEPSSSTVGPVVRGAGCEGVDGELRILEPLAFRLCSRVPSAKPTGRSTAVTGGYAVTNTARASQWLTRAVASRSTPSLQSTPSTSLLREAMSLLLRPRLPEALSLTAGPVRPSLGRPSRAK